jgi:hypothetical protein
MDLARLVIILSLNVDGIVLLANKPFNLEKQFKIPKDLKIYHYDHQV